MCFDPVRSGDESSMRQGWPGAVLLCAALGGCTLSDSLRHDDFRSVWVQPGNATATRTVVFATDREADDSELGYGLHWDSATHCGVADISIPGAFAPRAMPHWASTPIPQTIDCAAQAEMEGFARAVAERAKALACDHVLLFVHGYNQTFRTAMLRA